MGEPSGVAGKDAGRRKSASTFEDEDAAQRRRGRPLSALCLVEPDQPSLHEQCRPRRPTRARARSTSRGGAARSPGLRPTATPLTPRVVRRDTTRPRAPRRETPCGNAERLDVERADGERRHQDRGRAGDRPSNEIARRRADQVVADLVGTDDEHQPDDSTELETRADRDTRGGKAREERATNGVRRVEDRIEARVASTLAEGDEQRGADGRQDRRRRRARWSRRRPCRSRPHRHQLSRDADDGARAARSWPSAVRRPRQSSEYRSATVQRPPISASKQSMNHPTPRRTRGPSTSYTTRKRRRRDGWLAAGFLVVFRCSPPAFFVGARLVAISRPRPVGARRPRRRPAMRSPGRPPPHSPRRDRS